MAAHWSVQTKRRGYVAGRWPGGGGGGREAEAGAESRSRQAGPDKSGGQSGGAGAHAVIAAIAAVLAGAVTGAPGAQPAGSKSCCDVDITMRYPLGHLRRLRYALSTAQI